MTHLSVKAAAKRVKRSVRTIERWIADEDLEVTVIRARNGTVIRRFVMLDHLLAVYREKLVTNPTRKRVPNDDTPP